MTTLARSAPRYDELLRLLARIDGDEKHEASAHSTLDVLWVLFDRVLRHDPAQPDDPDRDRFFLSKGHGPHAFYAVLAAFGYVDPEELDRFGSFAGALGHHPDRRLVPGAEISSGSLGHGLPLAVGAALGLRIKGLDGPRVVVLLGDAELDEGSNHEAIALAGRLGLDRLVAVVVDNRSATYGWPGGIERRFACEGWTTAVAPGRDHDALEAAFDRSAAGRPHVVVATIENGGS
jgi:transketolase